MTNLILCGFQGVGKTALGRLLAKKVGASFYDTDELLLQKREGRATCAQIVRVEGEAAFRALESEVVFSLQGITHSVIALGGGTLDREENREIVLTLGQLVYLVADEKTVKKGARIQFAPFESLYQKRRLMFESLLARRIDCDGNTQEELEKVWQEITLEHSLRS